MAGSAGLGDYAMIVDLRKGLHIYFVE